MSAADNCPERLLTIPFREYPDTVQDRFQCIQIFCFLHVTALNCTLPDLCDLPFHFIEASGYKKRVIRVNIADFTLLMNVMVLFKFLTLFPGKDLRNRRDRPDQSNLLIRPHMRFFIFQHILQTLHGSLKVA